MKNIVVILILILGSYRVFASTNTDDKAKLKKVWKIQQIYFDSIPASVDTILTKFRMIPASDSVFYLYDGRSPKLMYWNLESEGQKIAVYQDQNFTGTLPFLEYMILYADDQNLILTLDLTSRNIGVNKIEYRLVPDPDFFNQ